MKDGRLHLTHKAEPTVMGVTVQAVDTGDTPSMVETLILATEPLDVVRVDALGIEAGVGDQGSHSTRC